MKAVALKWAFIYPGRAGRGYGYECVRSVILPSVPEAYGV